MQNTTVSAGGSFLVGETGGIGGTVNQTGGSFSVAGETRIGHWPNETSTYTLDGGQLTATGRFSVGWDGTGIFTQNSGNSQFNGGLSVAANANAAGGTVNMNDGTMSASYVYLSDSAYGRPGTFNQAGGTVTVAGHTRVGHWGGGPSTYDLTGGTLNANGNLYVGWDGVGIVNVNGPTAQLNASFIGLRGNNSILNIQDGTVTTGNFFLGEANGRSTTVNQSGGNVTANGGVRVGHWPNETSTYNMDNGTLTVNGARDRGRTGRRGDHWRRRHRRSESQRRHDHHQGLYLDSRGATGGTDQYNMTGGTLILTSGLGHRRQRRYRHLPGQSWRRHHPGQREYVDQHARHAHRNRRRRHLQHQRQRSRNPGAMSGPGGYMKTGGGDIGLRAANTHTGTTTIQQGRAIVYSNAALSAASDLTVNGELDLWNFSPTAKSLSGSGLVYANSATQRLTVGANNGSGDFSGIIQDSTWAGGVTLELSKIGSGTQILRGNNSYSGRTRVEGGVLDIRSNNALGSTAQYTDVFDGATLQVSGGLTVPEMVFLYGAGVGGNGAQHSAERQQHVHRTGKHRQHANGHHRRRLRYAHANPGGRLLARQ